MLWWKPTQKIFKYYFLGHYKKVADNIPDEIHIDQMDIHAHLDTCISFKYEVSILTKVWFVIAMLIQFVLKHLID